MFLVDFDAGQVVRKVPGAKLHPPPDVEGLWATVLESLVEDEDVSTDPTWYVTVVNDDGVEIDAPSTLLAKARTPGVRLLPGSMLSKLVIPRGVSLLPVKYTLGFPFARYSGNYEVTYGYDCGFLCSGSITLVMAHDASGWHILSRRGNWQS